MTSNWCQLLLNVRLGPLALPTGGAAAGGVTVAAPTSLTMLNREEAAACLACGWLVHLGHDAISFTCSAVSTLSS
jgi:hypothetical protein